MVSALVLCFFLLLYFILVYTQISFELRLMTIFRHAERNEEPLFSLIASKYGVLLFYLTKKEESPSVYFAAGISLAF